ncbi:MAG: hypothetical protein AB1921_04325 [Thermodesulfobacteriota bacterium]
MPMMAMTIMSSINVKPWFFLVIFPKVFISRRPFRTEVDSFHLNESAGAGSTIMLGLFSSPLLARAQNYPLPGKQGSRLFPAFYKKIFPSRG